MLIQENHLLSSQEANIRKRWQSSIYLAPFTSQARGVLIHKSIPFYVTWVMKDKTGMYIILQGTLIAEISMLQHRIFYIISLLQFHFCLVAML